MSLMLIIYLSSLLCFISLLLWSFLLFSLLRHYRYATLLFDLLPFYSPLTFLSFLLFSSGLALFSYFVSPWFSLLFLPALFFSLFLFRHFSLWSSSYSLRAYSSFLALISDSHRFAVHLFRDSSNIDSSRVNIFIRHDVDLSLSRLKRLTDLEFEHGLRSTCFFRLHSPKYSFSDALPLIKSLSSRGFEIGFHFENLSQSKGNKTSAISLFSEELSLLRQHVDIHTISHHGDRYHNEQLIEHLDLDSLGLSYAYSLDHTIYITDTGGAPLLTPGGEHLFLKKLSEAKPGDVVQILVHADWWY